MGRFDKKKRLLITGAGGFLGRQLCRRCATTWDVYGTVFNRDVQDDAIKVFKVDLTDFNQVKALFQTVKPDAVIHAAAASKVEACQFDAEASGHINVDASETIAGICGDHDIPCLFTSTDQVFGGDRAPYLETDPLDPINRYGEQKALAEEKMLGRCPRMVICRLPLIFGPGDGERASFLQPMLGAMRKGEPLHLFTDEFRTPVSVRAAVDGILLALNHFAGTIHLGGKERISRYRFGQMVKNVFKLDQAKLTACRQQDMDTGAPRPADVSLDSRKAYGLGFRPLSLVEELGYIRNGERSFGSPE
jgi:dTDP-4-dehydrorhamnose reductase